MEEGRVWGERDKEEREIKMESFGALGEDKKTGPGEQV